MKVIKGMRGLVVAFVVLALALTACGKSDSTDEDGEPAEPTIVSLDQAVPPVGQLMLTLPTSVAYMEQGGSLHLAPGDPDDGLTSMLLLPRMMLGITNQMTDMVKDVALHLFGKPECRDADPSNDPDDCDEYMGIVTGDISTDWQVFIIPEDEEGPYAVKFRKNPAGSDYGFTFYMYWQNEDDGLYYPGIEFSCTRTEDGGKGIFYFYPAYVADDEQDAGDDDDDGGGPSEIKITFDGTSVDKSLNLWFTGMATAQDPDQPDRMELLLSKGADEILKASGGFVRLALPAGTPPKEGPAAFNSTDAQSYIFTVAASDTENKGVQAMAIMDEDNFAVEDPFTDFAVDVLMEQSIVALFRVSSEDIDCATIGSVIETFTPGATGLPANICANQTNVTDAQVWEALEAVCMAPNPPPNSGDLCGSVLIFGNWSNPFYMDETGLIGTGSWNTPTSGYDDLVTALDGIDPIAPATLHELELPVPEGVAAVE